MGSIPRQLLLQLILILINAFFAMTEMAVVTLNAGKVRRMAEEGDKAAAYRTSFQNRLAGSQTACCDRKCLRRKRMAEMGVSSL